MLCGYRTLNFVSCRWVCFLCINIFTSNYNSGLCKTTYSWVDQMADDHRTFVNNACSLEKDRNVLTIASAFPCIHRRLTHSKTDFYGQRPRQQKRYKGCLEVILNQCDISLSNLESLTSDWTTWRSAYKPAVQRFEERWIGQLETKRDLYIILRIAGSHAGNFQWYLKPSVSIAEWSFRSLQDTLMLVRRFQKFNLTLNVLIV